MIIYFLLSLAGAALALAARSKRFIALAGLFFFAVQFGLAGLLLGGGRTGETSALFFRFDESGLLFYCLLCVVGPSSSSTRKPTSRRTPEGVPPLLLPADAAPDGHRRGLLPRTTSP